MPYRTNPYNEPIKKITELLKSLDPNSEEFAKTFLLKNDDIANYLTGFLAESDIKLLQDPSHLRNLKHGVIAMKWQSLHNIDFKISYSKLYETQPNSQPEFDIILKALLADRQK